MNNAFDFPIKARVRLTRDVERYDHFIARKDMTGTVLENDDHIFSIKLDQDLGPGCKEWDNCLVYSSDDESDVREDLELIAVATFPVKTKVTITAARVSDLLCNAFESGASWWLDVKSKQAPTREDFRMEGNTRYPLYEYPLNPGGSLTIRTYVDGVADEVNGKTEWEVNLETIWLGLQTMADKYPRLFQEILDEQDDANTADIFMQCVCFGEEVYC